MKSRSPIRKLLAMLTLTACATPAVATDAGGADAEVSACRAGALEPDAELAPWNGPGVDAETGALRPFEGTRLVSSTYIRIQADGVPLFQEHVGAIQAALATTPGLVAISFESSATCGTARTLVVWESAGAMYDFVSSPAHVAAMEDAPDIVRSGSAVTHWSASDASEVSWADAIDRVGEAPSLGTAP